MLDVTYQMVADFPTKIGVFLAGNDVLTKKLFSRKLQ